MHISKITLQGFKSFTEKTSLDFSAGISAVVGPNGCGKSNILDAMRWCFGTQSPKMLRGASMQDVIFAGSSKKAPSGFAEVSITFDNDKLDAPGAWQEVPEICLTRRIDRSGDGEYRMNNARVRRKDVQEFLMDIGYGEYSIVQQGQIGQLVQAKPDDVRIFIEQASRMTKYRARREEAQSKLSRTEENLERVLDLVQEIERQMNSLKRQAEKAKKAKEIDSELRAVSTVLLARDLDERGGRMDALKVELTETTDKIRQARIDISKHEADQEELHTDQETAESTFQAHFQSQRQLQDLRSELQSRLSALANESSLRKQETESAGLETAQIQEEIKQTNEDLAEIEPKAAEHEAFVAEHQQQLEAFDLRVREKRIGLDELRKNQETARAAIMVAQESQVDLRSTENKAKLTLDHAQERLGMLDLQIADIQDRLKQEQDKLAGMERQLSEAQSSAGQAALTHTEALENLKNARHALETRQQDRSQIVRQSQDVRIERDKVNSALTASQSIAELSQTEHSELLLPWALVSPQQGYEDLMETILADRFSALLVDTPDVAQALIDASGSDSEQRLRWFDRTHQAAVASFAAPAGTQPVADLLQVDEKHQDWVKRLTRGVFISEALLNPASPLPTGDWEVLWDRNGTCVTNMGLWSSGTLSQKGTAHLASRRDQLEHQALALDESLTGTEADIKVLEGNIEGLQARRDELADLMNDTQRASTDLNHEFSLAQQAIAQVQKEAEQRLSTRESLLAAQSDAWTQLETAQQELTLVDERLKSEQQKLAALDEKVVPLDAELNQMVAERDGMQRQIDGRREQLVILSRHVEASRERKNGQERRLGQLQNQIEFAAKREIEIDVEVGELTTRIDEHNEQLAQVAGTIEEIRSRQAAVREKQIALEKSIRTQNQMLDKFLQEQNRKEQELGELRHAVDSSIEQYTMRFGVEFERPDSDLDQPTEDLASIQETLENRRARLGAINPAALEEYEESKGRYDTMVEQREDLLVSIEKLRQSIRKMNKESRDKFKEAFHSVNNYFGEIFTKLFKGGKAELQLTDPDDWLESGVIIVAQPPGTNLQRLELLSGGQSAMTAISLILAIFLTNPSPFCILDEVDAPLDDSNVSRFNHVLVEMNELAQILMVTHNKQSMEIADTLYGITMEQRGISKAISVRLS